MPVTNMVRENVILMVNCLKRASEHLSKITETQKEILEDLMGEIVLQPENVDLIRAINTVISMAEHFDDEIKSGRAEDEGGILWGF